MSRRRRREVTKPPYRVPTMSEINALPHTGLTSVSTFSGCGGSVLGFRMAGFNHLWASEFIDAARETFRANFPGVFCDPRDIRDVKPEEILAVAGLERGQLDVLEGSPPCASFSLAGAREKLWGDVKKYSDVKQRVDDLFWEFARLVEGLAPRVFVAENVPGMTVGKAKGYYLMTKESLTKLGYRVSARILDASNYGVPQSRQRLIFVGVREDLARDPVFPRGLGYRYNLRDALVPRKLSTAELKECSIEGYAIGREWRKLREGQQSERYFQLVRPDRRKPCPTITQTGGSLSAACVTHPTEPRKFTIDELKRVCAFPDDFVLTGTYQQRWERCGRAVPPVMMRAVARAISERILDTEPT